MRFVLALWLSVAAAAAGAAPPQLDMTEFFSGRTHAENVLRITMQKPKKLVVDSVGRKDGNSFILIDTIHEEGKPVRQRKWVMRAAGPNRYTGTLTDAVGPVEVTTAGDSATIRYVMKEGGLKVEQKLQMRADGKSLSSRTVAKKIGIKFATVDGIVHKLD